MLDTPFKKKPDPKRVVDRSHIEVDIFIQGKIMDNSPEQGFWILPVTSHSDKRKAKTQGGI